MRMGGCSWLTRRPLPPVTHTHPLFADQSHSIPDNLVALLRHSRAWNCSGPERMIRRTRDRQYSWLAEIVKLAPGNVRYLRQCRENILGPSFTARDPEQTSIACSTSGARHSTIASQIVATGPSEGIRGKPTSWGCAYNCRDSPDLGIHRVTVDNDLRHDDVPAGRKPAVELDRKRQIFCWNGYAGKRDPAARVD